MSESARSTARACGKSAAVAILMGRPPQPTLAVARAAAKVAALLRLDIDLAVTMNGAGLASGAPPCPAVGLGTAGHVRSQGREAGGESAALSPKVGLAR